jgi:hypothetical protein
MPIILGPTGAPVSSPQSVTTQVVFDYLTDTAGAALVGSKIQCTLNYSAGPVVASPAVSIGPVQQVTTTDSNGYWQFNLVPNVNISPANTTYTIQTPYTAYDITVGTTGPFQSTAVGTIVNTPAPLAPATTNLTGPITISGNETVTGTLTVQGATTLQGGLTAQNGETLTGGLTITDAASRIIPGATSMSLRNNANNADNLLITNAGAATVRNGLTVTAGGVIVTAGGLTVTAGDETLTAGRLVLGAASSKIVPGATQLSLRNNADSADNILVTDAGVVTTRNALTVTTGGATITGQIVNASALYTARVHNNGVTSLVGNAVTKIIFQAKDWDPNGNFDNTTNYQYTVPRTGKYLVEARTSAGANVRMYVAIFQNGVEAIRGNDDNATSGVTGSCVMGRFAFTQGDLIDARAFITTTTNCDVGTSQTYFGIHYLHD